jgi:hypothetical protein
VNSQHPKAGVGEDEDNRMLPLKRTKNHYGIAINQPDSIKVESDHPLIKEDMITPLIEKKREV